MLMQTPAICNPDLELITELIKSLMLIRKRYGDSTAPCLTPFATPKQVE